MHVQLSAWEVSVVKQLDSVYLNKAAEMQQKYSKKQSGTARRMK
jgi:hypothetical protein